MWSALSSHCAQLFTHHKICLLTRQTIKQLEEQISALQIALENQKLSKYHSYATSDVLCLLTAGLASDNERVEQQGQFEANMHAQIATALANEQARHAGAVAVNEQAMREELETTVQARIEAALATRAADVAAVVPGPGPSGVPAKILKPAGMGFCRVYEHLEAVGVTYAMYHGIRVSKPFLLCCNGCLPPV